MRKILTILFSLFLANPGFSQGDYKIDSIPYDKSKLHIFSNSKELIKEIEGSAGYFVCIKDKKESIRLARYVPTFMYEGGIDDREFLWKFSDGRVLFLNNESYLLFDSSGTVLRNWKIGSQFIDDSLLAVGTFSNLTIDDSIVTKSTVTVMNYNQRIMYSLFGDQLSLMGDYYVTKSWETGYVVYDKEFNQLSNPVHCDELTEVKGNFLIEQSYHKYIFADSSLTPISDTFGGSVEVVNDFVINFAGWMDFMGESKMKKIVYDAKGGVVDSGSVEIVRLDGGNSFIKVQDDNHMNGFYSREPYWNKKIAVKSRFKGNGKNSAILESESNRLIALDPLMNTIKEFQFNKSASMQVGDHAVYLYKDGYWYQLDSCYNSIDTLGSHIKNKFIPGTYSYNSAFVLDSLSVPGETQNSFPILSEFNHLNKFGRNLAATELSSERYEYIVDLSNRRVDKVVDKEKFMKALGEFIKDKEIFTIDTIINTGNNEHLRHFLSDNSDRNSIIKMRNFKISSVSPSRDYVICYAELNYELFGNNGGYHWNNLLAYFVLNYSDLRIRSVIPTGNDDWNSYAFFTPDSKRILHITHIDGFAEFKIYGVDQLNIQPIYDLKPNIYVAEHDGFWSADGNSFNLFCSSDSLLQIDVKRGFHKLVADYSKRIELQLADISLQGYSYVKNKRYKLFMKKSNVSKMIIGDQPSEYFVYLFDYSENSITDSIQISKYSGIPPKWSYMDYDPETGSLMLSFNYTYKNTKLNSFDDFNAFNHTSRGYYNCRTHIFKAFIEYVTPSMCMMIDSSKLFIQDFQSNYIIPSISAGYSPYIFDVDKFEFHSLNNKIPMYMDGVSGNCVFFQSTYEYTSSRNSSYSIVSKFDLKNLNYSNVPDYLAHDFDNYYSMFNVEDVINGYLEMQITDFSNVFNVINTRTSDTLLLILYADYNWIITDAEGNYYCSTGFEKEILLKRVVNDELNYFNSVTKYRPDIILTRLGFHDNRVVEKAKKIISQSAKQNVKFKNNEIRITKESSIQGPGYTWTRVKLSFELKGELKSLKCFNNKVQYRNAIISSSRVEDSYEIILPVPVVDGTNRFSVEITSDLDTVFGEYNFDQPKVYFDSDLYFVGIGTSDYEGDEHDLEYTINDIKGVFKALKKSQRIDNAEKMFLINNSVTRENLKSIKEFLGAAKPHDLVVFYIAGHGVLDEDLKFYYAPHDMDFYHPSEKGIKLEDIIGLMDSAVSVKRLVFFDACHSGGLDEEKLDDDIAQGYSGKVNFRSNTSPGTKQNQIIHQLYQQQFANSEGAKGITVISASSGAEVALESEQWKHGLFSAAIIDALSTYDITNLNNDESIDLNELFVRLKSIVSETSNGMQNPEFYSVNRWISYDF